MSEKRSHAVHIKAEPNMLEAIDLTSDSPPSKRSRTSIKVPNHLLQVYRQILPDNPAAIKYLYSSDFAEALDDIATSVGRKYLVNKEDALEEFRRLIAIKIFTADKDAMKISPTPLMDDLWHAAILDTQFYAELQAGIGFTLRHRPGGAAEQESEFRIQRVKAMEGLYKAFFSYDTVAHPVYFPRPDMPTKAIVLRSPGAFDRTFNVFTRDQFNNKLRFTVDGNTTSEEIMKALDSAGYSREKYRFLWDGKPFIQGNDTLTSQGIEAGDVFTMMAAQYGC